MYKVSVNCNTEVKISYEVKREKMNKLTHTSLDHNELN